jgi:hypothetical protein
MNSTLKFSKFFTSFFFQSILYVIFSCRYIDKNISHFFVTPTIFRFTNVHMLDLNTKSNKVNHALEGGNRSESNVIVEL